MKKLVAVLAAMGISFGAGYWLERQPRMALQKDLDAVRARLAETEARARLGDLLGRLLVLMDTVSRQDYGEALKLSTPFFDEVRAESLRSPQGAAREALSSTLALRDRVTESLARGDTASLDLLRQVLDRLRGAWGSSPVPASPVSPAPSPTPSPEPAVP